MKSIHAGAIATPLMLLLVAAPALGQSPQGPTVTRGQVTAISGTKAPVAVSVSAERIAVPGGFPSLKRSARDGSHEQPTEPNSATSRLTGPAITVGFSLVVVLGLFAGLVWMTRKFGTRGMSQGALPKEVLEGLGSMPIDARTRITLVRCGHRILVIAQTPAGVQPLSEIVDPEEVRELTAQCLGNSKQAFASALKTVEQETTPSGYVGNGGDPPSARSRGRLFATA